MYNKYKLWYFLRSLFWFFSGTPYRPHCGTGNRQRKSMILSQNSKKHFPSTFMGNIPYSCREFSSSKGKILQPFKIFKYSSKQTLLKWQTEDQIEGWINIIMPNFDCQYFLHVTWNIYWEINVTYIKPMLSKIIYSYGYSITYGYWISPMKMRSLWEGKKYLQNAARLLIFNIFLKKRSNQSIK